MAAIWARSLARSGGHAQTATSPSSGARISDVPAAFLVVVAAETTSFGDLRLKVGA